MSQTDQAKRTHLIIKYTWDMSAFGPTWALFHQWYRKSWTHYVNRTVTKLNMNNIHSLEQEPTMTGGVEISKHTKRQTYKSKCLLCCLMCWVMRPCNNARPNTFDILRKATSTTAFWKKETMNSQYGKGEQNVAPRLCAAFVSIKHFCNHFSIE